MEAYVDYMVVKSNYEADRLDNLRETFDTLCKYKMKLNPMKYVFTVSLGKFLGFMVSQRGIEANPDKIKAIMEIKSPNMVKEVQSLIGKVNALNKFISRAINKCLPFFKVLKKAFQWTNECKEALTKLKNYLTQPPLLSLSIMGEKMHLYLAVSNTEVSLALIREDEDVQRPVYYTSHAF